MAARALILLRQTIAAAGKVPVKRIPVTPPEYQHNRRDRQIEDDLCQYEKKIKYLITGTVRYGTFIPYVLQISIALPGSLRVRTIYSIDYERYFANRTVRYRIVTLHVSCVRLISPSDLARARACVRVSSHRGLFLY